MHFNCVFSCRKRILGLSLLYCLLTNRGERNGTMLAREEMIIYRHTVTAEHSEKLRSDETVFLDEFF